MVVTRVNQNLGEVKTDCDCVSHNVELLGSLNTQRQSKILCDVVLLVQGDELPAHKGVLAANSNYFLAMFTTDMAEKTMEKVKILGITASAMRQVLDFIYTGVVKVTEENVRELLEASTFLLMSKVQTVCSNFLQRILVAENCLAILSTADEFGCETLHRHCINFLCQNFLVVSQTEDFAQLDGESVSEILLSDDLNVEEEEDLLNVVIKWIKHDLENRKHLLPMLMKNIRFKFIQTPLKRVVALLEGFPNYLVYDVNQSCTNDSVSTTAPRKSYSTVKLILAVGGCSNSRILNQSYCYIPGRNKWKMLGTMNVPRWRLGLVQTKDATYAVGGVSEVASRDGTPSFVEKYDASNDSWDVVKTDPSLPVDRDHYGTTVHAGNLLVVGGIDPRSVLAEREVISLDLKRTSHPHTTLAPMLVPRTGHCVVTSERYVYAIGGAQTHDIEAPLSMNTVERYNPRTNSWDLVTPLTENRCYAAAAWCEGKLYVIGGHNGRSVLSCGEMYDPDMNHWQLIAPLNTPRIKSGIAVHGGQIYVMGGVRNLRGRILNTVECYNPSENRWSVASHMPTEAFDLQCCEVEVPYKRVASVMIDE